MTVHPPNTDLGIELKKAPSGGNKEARSGLVLITKRLPKKVKLTPITIGNFDPIFHTGYNCIIVPSPAANMEHCKISVISAGVKCSLVP